MEEKKIVQWYVQPVGSHTNFIIAEMVGQGIEENICPQEVCADGVRRDFLKVTPEQLVQCVASKRSSKLTFRIFARVEAGIVPALIMSDGEVPESDMSENVVSVSLESLCILKNILKPLRSSYQRGTFPFNASKLRQDEFLLKTPVRARK